MILSFYGVIAGWAMAYVGDTATGDFVDLAERQRAKYSTSLLVIRSA